MSVFPGYNFSYLMKTSHVSSGGGSSLNYLNKTHPKLWLTCKARWTPQASQLRNAQLGMAPCTQKRLQMRLKRDPKKTTGSHFPVNRSWEIVIQPVESQVNPQANGHPLFEIILEFSMPHLSILMNVQPMYQPSIVHWHIYWRVYSQT